MKLEQTLGQFAKGCFLAGTLISTPYGEKAIEDVKVGDTVTSYNEETQQLEESKVGEIDVLYREGYYVINGVVKATAEHPFYTTRGIVEVKYLDTTHYLIMLDGSEERIQTIEYIPTEVTVYNLLDVLPNNNYFADEFLVHNKGCFLPGTKIQTPTGQKKIEKLRPGDTVISYNEHNRVNEYSKLGSLQVLEESGYYIINDSIKVTGSHPMYVGKVLTPEMTIVPVHKLKIGDNLITDAGWQTIYKLEYISKNVKVYNLIDVVPNHNYYAQNYLVHNKGGGGCFLAGTRIQTESGYAPIETIVPGQEILSVNEKTGKQEVAKVERLDRLVAEKYYIINDDIKVTGEHPFYTIEGIKKVSELKVGDTLRTIGDDTLIVSIETIEEDVQIYNLINVVPNHNYYANGYLVHNKGFSGGGRSSSSAGKSSGGKSGSSSKPAAPPKGKSTAKPGAKVKAADGKEVTSSTKKPTNKKVSESKGVVGDNGYAPKFSNGYTPPAGSVVYQRDSNLMDYFFLYYLFNNDNPSRPENRETVIVQPDGKEVTAKPEPQGVDGMMVFNWIVFIIVALALIAGVMWGVTKYVNRDKNPKKDIYGW
jgi:hypothetical protein